MMTPEMLMALMLTMRCHSMVVDIPERHETIVHTVCVRINPQGDTETRRQEVLPPGGNPNLRKSTQVYASAAKKTKLKKKKATKPSTKKSRLRKKKRS